MAIEILRWLHIVGAAVLLGTGAGIAFFMMMSHRTRNPAAVAHTAGVVVAADCVFTASAVVLQPITGIALAVILGWPVFDGWVAISMALYVLAGICWLPVIWIQIRMRDLAREAARCNADLPAGYYACYRWWFGLGIPAFLAVLAIIWLMVAKPALKLLG
ncbi:MAG: DUF2269 domain-containing protein [Gammaproteobacteria bacterium]|nr:DUF2269 domain-containing protein [Gammaproteobacteria bacterium]